MAAAASFSLKICGGGIIFPTKLAAAASFSYKIGGGGKDLATLLAVVLTWSGYWELKKVFLERKVLLFLRSYKKNVFSFILCSYFLM